MALAVARRLLESGDEVAVCAAGASGPLRDECGQLVLYGQQELLAGRTLVSFLRLLRRSIRGFRPDVVITHMLPLNLLVLGLRRLCLIPGRIVAVEHNHLSAAHRTEGASRARQRMVRFAIRALYTKADALVGVSEDVARDVAARLPTAENVVVIENGIDVQRVRAGAGATTDESEFVAGLARPVLVTAGRLVPQKGFSDLLEAFIRIRASAVGRDASLVILGDGPLRDDLECQARNLGVADAVHFRGFVENPWAAMARADVFVLSSHHEGLPLVLAEAVACGLPVVATDCESGPADILDGNARARLVPVGAPPAIAHAVGEVLREAGRTPPVELAERFTVDAMAAGYLSLLARVVERSSL